MSAYKLDEFEVTVGRFRAFVAAVAGNLRGYGESITGKGKNPHIPAYSGWRAEWNERLPATSAELNAELTTECQVGGDVDNYGALTWTAAAGAGDALPINCVSWYALHAFCIWDGGRLPTDAEWLSAAEGGAAERQFPWIENSDIPSGALITSTYSGSPIPTWEWGKDFVVSRLPSSTFSAAAKQDINLWWHTFGPKDASAVGNVAHVAPPGKMPLGNGKFGHADLAGNVYEWMLDENATAGACTDCADVAFTKADQLKTGTKDNAGNEWDPGDARGWSVGGTRLIHGGSWEAGVWLTAYRGLVYPIGRTYYALGGRCARDG